MFTLCCYSEGKIFVGYASILIYDLNRQLVFIFKVYIITNVFQIVTNPHFCPVKPLII